MDTTATYQERRGELETYFDRTAVETWSQLTSDAPVSRVRQTVRAGRDRMRETLLRWLGHDLRGRVILDAGCGTGALSMAAAKRGAAVSAVDLSPTLINLAQERIPHDLGAGTIDFHVGDMLSPALGPVDHVVAMDSLVHYRAEDMVAMVSALAAKARRSVLFTFAPRTPALSLMHAAGTLFPRSDRAPAIEPVGQVKLQELIERATGLQNWRTARTERVQSRFYTSQAVELVRQ